MKQSKTPGISMPPAAAKKAPGISVAKPAGGISLAKPAANSKPKEQPKSPLETIDGMEQFVDSDETHRMRTIDALFLPAEGEQLEFNTTDLAMIVKRLGITSNEGSRIISVMVEGINSTTTACERALLLLKKLFTHVSKKVEPFAFPLLPKFLSLHADRSQTARDLAAAICGSLADTMNPNTFRVAWATISAAMADEDWRIKVGALQMLKSVSPRMSRQLSPLLPEIIPQATNCIVDPKKQVQTIGLEALNEACLAITNDDIRPLTPQLVSVIARPEESEKTLNALLETTFVSNVDAATLALIGPLLGKVLRMRGSSQLKRKAARVIDNMCRLVREPADVAPFMPLLLPALEKVIDEIVDEEVCSVAKAAREILLKANGEGIANSSEKSTVTKVVTTPINPYNLDVEVVKKNLLGFVTKVVSVGGDAAAKMKEVSSVNSIEGLSLEDDVRTSIPSSERKEEPAREMTPAVRTVCEYIAMTAAYLVVYDTQANPSLPEDCSPADVWRWSVSMSETKDWKECIAPFAAALEDPLLQSVAAPASSPETGDDAESTPENKDTPSESEGFGEKIAVALRSTVLGDIPDAQVFDDKDGGNVCDIEFSLAFGGKILLHNAKLRLGRGRRYGVMGKNGAGKTTLLTNIGSGNIEGMPPHLKMVYVQHDDRTPDNGVPLLEEIAAGKDMVEAGVTKDDIENALRNILFTDEMLTSPRSCLSGGWKMKVLIVRAMLARADILLLDEPTNHLDTASVNWLTNYLQHADGITALIVSHDIPFLDNVITDVVHYENRKLVYYHGNMTHFVKIHPEAKYYYELDDSTLKFKFPVPERLDGIASTTKAVLKMDNITFTYPGASKPQLIDVSVKLCLASRVAVVGANGAGKSTLIRLMVQETEPDLGSGEVWKHHNLRLAYVAQHSFHHIEEHLDESPVDYMKWRFGSGVDREDLARPNMKLTEEEEQADKNRVKKYGDVDKVVGRRKNGRTLEYECTWIGQGEKLVDARRGRNSTRQQEENLYIPLEKMVEMGLIKLVQQMDAKIAAANAGLDMRPLITAEIQGHLDDFGLEAEFGTHGNIRRMSGGQKVKLVLAAAMWNKPHLLVLDEPTNYLDRQALGALTQAIKTFHGGVIIISHNSEFTDAICNEKWLVEAGRVTVVGEAEETSMKVSASANNKIRKSKSSTSTDNLDAAITGQASGNINKVKTSEVILNPRTLEVLSKKEARQLARCAEAAGVSLKEYVSKITCKSPEWQWLGSFQKG